MEEIDNNRPDVCIDIYFVCICRERFVFLVAGRESGKCLSECSDEKLLTIRAFLSI